jgi:DNA modification methylase
MISETEKDEQYYFHQTPESLCIKLIKHVPLVEGDIVLEPFKGEGNFYNNLPDYIEKEWTELTEGRDYKDYVSSVDWIVTNPPFKILENGKQVNAFYKLIKHYTTIARKGIAFLGNDNCFKSLTPPRMKELNELGWYIHNITTCNIKKWYGRYYFIIFKKEPSDFFKYICGSF